MDLAAQCVCLDDLERVAGRLDWERGLFALLRELAEHGGRLAVAAASTPALLSWTLPDVGSRFASLAVYQLRVLDETEQQQALQLRARLRGFTARRPRAGCNDAFPVTCARSMSFWIPSMRRR